MGELWSIFGQLFHVFAEKWLQYIDSSVLYSLYVTGGDLADNSFLAIQF